MSAAQRPSPGAVVISIDCISKAFPIPLTRLKQFFRRPVKPPVQALSEVSLDVHAGEIFGLIGRNGAGKTTLTKIIATLVQPTSGAVSVNGFDSVRDDGKVRAQVGLATAEERSFYWRLTVEQNLMFFARLYGLSDATARRRIIELVNQFELKELVSRRFGELSTGNKQRMAFARAMLARPPVLLLDEPTRSLDPMAAARMRALINSLAGGDPPVTILLTSHNLTEVEELCARVAVISRGRIRALDTPQSLRTTHRQTERVELTVRGIPLERARSVLASTLDGLELKEEGQTLHIAFMHESGDDLLDVTVRALQENDGKLLAFDRERATLLDVLESYEKEQEASEES
ncbi:MAG: type transport system ATP-binding protein [Acidobacteriota bacterium]|jgi:ABC-2 type transport system ATP-binding protein|nr:type transport system ATP-binding protein [Acidobacteriota bacterium]